MLQTRLTGDPYIVHCVETALIVEALHASSKALEDIDERYGLSADPLLSAYNFRGKKLPPETDSAEAMRVSADMRYCRTEKLIPCVQG